MMKQYDNKSNVETIALQKSGYDFIAYAPTERVGAIIVPNFPNLGKLAAQRFIEWVQRNPGGVISLPTGKTPEHFIKWVSHYLKRWNHDGVQKELVEAGINPSIKPEMSSLYFAQIDEFFPISPLQHNSFNYYVKKYYIDGFQLDPSKALLIDTSSLGLLKDRPIESVFPDYKVDLSLRNREPIDKNEFIQKNVITLTDQFCVDYETKIRELGGIGFFLGGIGPDGHIAFNVQYSDHYSTTRLTNTNYKTQAAAAGDLGGIEIARGRPVITIGLETIVWNPTVTAIIFAAGEAKAGIVSEAIESMRSINAPASVLQGVSGARFYLTRGAASKLTERRIVQIMRQTAISDAEIESAVVSLSIHCDKPMTALTREDYLSDRFASETLKKSGMDVSEVSAKARQGLLNKIDRGLSPVSNASFLHTEPHHDDIMLAYLPHVYHAVRDPSNHHHFTCFTSGFNAVTNIHILNELKQLKQFLKSGVPTGVRNMEDCNRLDERNRDVNLYLEGIAAERDDWMKEACARRLLRNLIQVLEDDNISNLMNRIDELVNYFTTQYPGKKDLPYIQVLKGMIREWESELLWGYFGFHVRNVSHLRLGFYQGDIFTETPTISRDVLPILNQIREINPSIVTVAQDPEGSGPDTHYKVMQAVTEALRMYRAETDAKAMRVWGYRNVWFRFMPWEVNQLIPVSLNSIAVLNVAFMNCYLSQREASFPSYDYDGPFSNLSQRIWINQYQMIKTCLGNDFFLTHPHPRMRAAKGMIFLNEMTLDEFFSKSDELRKTTESA